MSHSTLDDGPGFDPAELDYAKGGGLVTGVVQHAVTGQVLMVGHLDEAAVRATLETGRATFWSRSRGEPWVKGETSGHWLEVRSVAVDCDLDTLLVRAVPAGPTCHTGEVSCFGPDADAGSFVHALGEVVRERHVERPAGSYTTALFEGGLRRIAQKVGEEGVETALAGVVQDDDELLGESADLLYHLLVLLRARGLSLGDVEAVLRSRHG